MPWWALPSGKLLALCRFPLLIALSFWQRFIDRLLRWSWRLWPRLLWCILLGLLLFPPQPTSITSIIKTALAIAQDLLISSLYAINSLFPFPPFNPATSQNFLRLVPPSLRPLGILVDLDCTSLAGSTPSHTFSCSLFSLPSLDHLWSWLIWTVPPRPPFLSENFTCV